MKMGITRKATLALALVMGAVTMLGTGCAIHSQAPIKEVAYDFSDADFYDRAYAASPVYEDDYVEYREMREAYAKASAEAEEADEADGAPAAVELGFVRAAR